MRTAPVFVVGCLLAMGACAGDDTPYDASLDGLAVDWAGNVDASVEIGAAESGSDTGTCGQAAVGSSSNCLAPPSAPIRGEEFSCASENAIFEAEVLAVETCTECSTAPYARLRVKQVINHCNKLSWNISIGDEVIGDQAAALAPGQSATVSCWLVQSCSDGCTGTPQGQTPVCRDAYFGCSVRCYGGRYALR